MIYRIAVFFCVAACVASGAEDITFPPGFKFGVATSAFQVEGAWNVTDKGLSVWDKYVNEGRGSVKDGSNANVACDSYHLWRRDVEMLDELGVDFYRFSISWSRLLPYGFINKISEDGNRYYNDLIDGLLKKNIKPVVTLFHDDLPQNIQDLGGWANPLTADWFGEYARVVFSRYADRVKTWLTFNEPLVVCNNMMLIMNDGVSDTPGISSPSLGIYLCFKNLMIAHAKAWRIYDEEFKHLYHGEVSIANSFLWIEGKTPEDEEAAEAESQNVNGRFCHPIYSKEGGWPPVLEKHVTILSKMMGFPHSNLPSFTPEEIELVKGTYDFFALNQYTSRVALRNENEDARDGPMSMPVTLECLPEWPEGPSSWYCENPGAIRKQLSWLKNEYGDLNYFISENGYPTTGGLEDQNRIDFYKEYFKQLALSIKEDGVNVTGYTMWSLMDNFEWGDGYTVKYGLYEVDFDSPNKTRTPRASATFYKDLIRTKTLPQV